MVKPTRKRATLPQKKTDDDLRRAGASADRRSSQDRRVFPRPEGRRSSDGRRTDDSK